MKIRRKHQVIICVFPEITTRPTLGFTIATAQWAEQAPLLYRLIDFTWWTNDSTPQEQVDEQLELLSRDQHDWGGVWSDLTTIGLLKNNSCISDAQALSLEQGLLMRTDEICGDGTSDTIQRCGDFGTTGAENLGGNGANYLNQVPK